ncbi:hypothetical protein [Photobacterium satsumensis]|uniref:hypothetical protein n=1 Tax=Photobacterium satsumensis TaxID=2910239 RepID=UPI003D0F270D
MLIPAKSVNSFFEYLEKIRLFVGYLDELGVCRAKQLLLCVLVRLKAIKQHCWWKTILAVTALNRAKRLLVRT